MKSLAISRTKLQFTVQRKYLTMNRPLPLRVRRFDATKFLTGVKPLSSQSSSVAVNLFTPRIAEDFVLNFTNSKVEMSYSYSLSNLKV